MAALAGTNVVSDWEGMYKKVYADDPENAIPLDTILQGLIEFREDESDGEDFNVPVALKLPLGISYAATNAGAFALAGPQAAKKKNAKITGSQLLLQNSLDYESAAKSTRSEAAFRKATAQAFADMKDAIHKFLEIELFYGQAGHAKVSDVNGNVLTITTAEWAPGTFSGLDEMPIGVYDGITSGANARALATAIDTGGVDLDNKKITIDNAANVVAGDYIFLGKSTAPSFDGTTHNSCVGLHQAATHSSGLLWNIDSDSWSLWKPNLYDFNGERISFLGIQQMAARGMSRGLDTGGLLLVNPLAFADLATDQAAMRRYGAERNPLENGTESIRFYTVVGPVSITPSIYVREGYCYLISPEKWARRGATDVTFDLQKQGVQGGQIFRHMDGYAGLEWRCYSHQAPFTPKLGHVVTGFGIVNYVPT